MVGILDLFEGKSGARLPIWFMRQAGRYLPEYRSLRSHCLSFLDLCYTPDLAAQVTLQPLERFDLDAAILFSDILVVPDALGQRVWFEEEKGPQLSGLDLKSFHTQVCFGSFREKLSPVYAAIHLIKKKAAVPLIGFSGAPWTLGLYMLQGEGSRDFAKAKQEAFQNEEAFDQLLELLVKAVSRHLIEQIRAGVNIIQLFDTWAGLCPATHFRKWIFSPTEKIIKNIRQEFPAIPIIGFPRGLGINLLTYGKDLQLSGLGLDSSVPLSLIKKELPEELVFQGNLDPSLLVAGGEVLERAIYSIHHEMDGKPYIFNLGHGILPQTPLSHVEMCIKLLRSLEVRDFNERKNFG